MTTVIERVREARDQFAFYAREHSSAGKLEKAATNQRFSDSLSVALEALAASSGERGAWQDIATAPYSTPVRIRAGHMTFEAALWPGVSEDDEGRSCDQWQAVHEGEHPPCWSEGACWSSNLDEVMSLQPDAWQALATPATVEEPKV